MSANSPKDPFLSFFSIEESFLQIGEFLLDLVKSSRQPFLILNIYKTYKMARISYKSAQEIGCAGAKMREGTVLGGMLPTCH